MTALMMLPTSMTLGTWFYVAAGIALVCAAGASPLLSWFLQNWRRPMVRRIVFATILAFLIGASSSYASIFGPCDEFWIMFWICVAP